MKHVHTRQGFTIVELLIVIVIIAILAAITIVAYNGIQNRAKQTSAQSLVTQANKKVLAYAVQNSDTYPADLAAAGVTNTDNALQYTVNNDSSPRTYGLTATNGDFSYYMSNTVTKPTSGGYPGHGQGTAVAVTNQFYNPRFTGASAPTNQTGTSTTIATYTGSARAQATTTSSAAVSMRLQPNLQRWNIAAGQNLYASVVVYNDAPTARSLSMTIRTYDTTGSSLGTIVDTIGSGSQIIAPGDSATFVASGVSTAGAISAGINVNRDSGSGAVSGDIYYADNVYFSDRAALFTDGSNTNWVWKGEENNSPSTGPIRT